MYVLALSDYKQLAAAAGYKPAPQLGSLQLPLVSKTLSPPHQLFLKRVIMIIIENQYVKHNAFLPY